MNLFVYIIVLIFISNLCYNTSYKQYKNFIKKLYSYKLGNDKYITSVQYVYYENKLKVIIYSKSKNIKLNKSIIIYENFFENCEIVFVYRYDWYNFNLFEISTKSNNIPKILVINDINIIIPKSSRNNKYRFVSCYSVMSNFHRPLLLTELIESNIHFGVSKLVFYYYSSSKKVKQILQYYSEKGIVDVYQYQNDTDFKKKEGKRNLDIFHFLLFKMNHCFNEYKTNSNHMMFLDLDEILWPVKSYKYEDMLLSIPQIDLYYIHAYFFICNYEIPNNIEKNISTILPDIDIFSVKKYCPTSNGYTHKYIMINTNMCITAHIHDPLLKYKTSKAYMSSDVAFIRHTRHFNNPLKKQCPYSKLLLKNKTNLEMIIFKKSKNVFNYILRQ